MLASVTTMHISSLHMQLNKYVLDFFQNWFIKYMDTSAIVYSLKDKEVISDGA